MTNPVPDLRPAANQQTPRIKRRGLLGALGALAAGAVAKLTEAPVSAGTDGDVVLGADNVTQATTTIRGSVGAAGLVVAVDGRPGAIVGISERRSGVVGTTQYGHAIGGRVMPIPFTQYPLTVGVYGSNESTYELNGPGTGGFGV
jgi:hypothetical protein